jgi:transposase
VKKYKVTLDPDERRSLLGLIAAGKASALKLARARILLKADAGTQGPAWTDARIAEAVEVDPTTVERVRQRFVEEGLEAALVRKKQACPSRERKLDGAAEARLVALACSDPPQGRAAWTLQLLADRLVELRVVDSISDETVRQVLKKRTQAVAEGAVVYPAGGRRRVRLRDGGRTGSLPQALRRGEAGGLSGRGQQTADRRDGRADPR